MKFEDNRTFKNQPINIGDLIICETAKYQIIKDIDSGEQRYNYHLVNADTFEIEDSFNELNKAYDIVAECEEVLDIVPRDRLKIVAE